MATSTLPSFLNPRGTTAIAENVVPKSIPSILLIIFIYIILYLVNDLNEYNNHQFLYRLI
jgi:hypothetical protein